MIKNVLSLFLVILLSQFTIAQEAQNKCGTDELDLYNKTHSPEYASFRLKQEKLLKNYNYNNKASTILIPVVVHVIYRLPEQNISDAQIHSQIDVLNKDFNKLNWDISKVPSVWQSLIADCGIEFILANRDPSENMTNGITRKSTTIQDIASISGSAHYTPSLGGEEIWDRNQYLNIWVCEISGGVYGFGSMPGVSAASDGVVINFISFGTEGTAGGITNKGRTATHEVGHWLDLYHPWGLSQCGDDFVNDTPIHKEGNYGCGPFPHTTTCNSTSNGEMFMNFMDYSNDDCLNFFTLGQKIRMNATINSARSTLLTSKGYNGISNIEKKYFKVFPTPASEYIKIEVGSDLEINKIEVLNINGVKVSEIEVVQPRADQSVFVGQFNDGMYFLKLYTNKGLFTEKVLVWHH